MRLFPNIFEGIGHTAWWDIEVFRKLMAVDMMPSYKPFKALNRNVIQPAMKEVNKLSNIQIEMETRMKGRTVTGLRFIVRPNAQQSLVGMDTEDEITDRSSYKALLAQGISKTLARAWVIEYDEDLQQMKNDHLLIVRCDHLPTRMMVLTLLLQPLLLPRQRYPHDRRRSPLHRSATWTQFHQRASKLLLTM